MGDSDLKRLLRCYSWIIAFEIAVGVFLIAYASFVSAIPVFGVAVFLYVFKRYMLPLLLSTNRTPRHPEDKPKS